MTFVVPQPVRIMARYRLLQSVRNGVCIDRTTWDEFISVEFLGAVRP